MIYVSKLRLSPKVWLTICRISFTQIHHSLKPHHPPGNEYLYSKNGCGNTQKNHSKNSKESLSEDKEAQVSLLMNESGFKKWFGF